MAVPQMTDLFKTLGARIADAHNAAKDVPVNTGGGIGLPDGVRGVAQLTVMEFIEGKKDDDKGKFYFRAAGVVQTPQHHEGIKCAGKQTSVLIPFFDTPKRQNKKSFVEHHWPAYRDLFAKLGVQPPPEQQPGETKDAANARIWQYYQGAQQILLQQRPYFEFHTWKGEKATEGPYKGQESRVSEFWDGRTEYVPPPSSAAANPAAGVGPAPSANGTQANHAPPAAAAAPPPPPPPVPPPTAAAVAFDDAKLAAWADAADSDGNPPDTDEGREGVTMLSAVCKQVGITNDEARPLDWAGVAALIRTRAAGTAAGAPTTAAGTRPDPVKGALVTYGGAAGCEVTSVNPEAKTVTLKGADKKAVKGADGKLLKVPFAELS